MANKRTKLKEISSDEFPAWLRSVIGDRTIEEFAASIGFKRQRISAVLNHRESPGALLIEALGNHGLVAAKTVYVVQVPHR